MGDSINILGKFYRIIKFSDSKWMEYGTCVVIKKDNLIVNQYSFTVINKVTA